MLQKFLIASAISIAALMGGSQLSGAIADENTQSLDHDVALETNIALIEALVLQYQHDAAGLMAAIEAHVNASDNPEQAGIAVLAMLENSSNQAVKDLMMSRPELKAAVGSGLGAAIATIALTDPDLATKMTARVISTGDISLVASVQRGSDTKTASLRAQGRSYGDTNKGDSTPENPGSPS